VRYKISFSCPFSTPRSQKNVFCRKGREDILKSQRQLLNPHNSIFVISLNYLSPEDFSPASFMPNSCHTQWKPGFHHTYCLLIRYYYLPNEVYILHSGILGFIIWPISHNTSCENQLTSHLHAAPSAHPSLSTFPSFLGSSHAQALPMI
jgi:hypothetical protein